MRALGTSPAGKRPLIEGMRGTALAVLFLTVRVASPQELKDVPTFTSAVSNVRIDAQVTTGKNVVRGLGPADFEVRDNGVPQPLLYAALDIEPIDMLLLLDVSGSMREHVTEMSTMATDALKHLRRGDRVAIMVFAKSTRVTTELNDDLDQIPAAIAEAAKDETVGSETATNAAILAGMQYLEESSKKLRRAILIVTDNIGENYRLRDEAVIEALLKTNVLLESIVVGKKIRIPEPGTRVSKNPDITLPNVFWISEETGGEAVVSSEAAQAFPDMVARIRVRYSLQYRAPASKPGEFREIDVKLTPAAKLQHPQAVVRARRGYYVRD
jgi:VWFA-related protein